jgi:hypothetical protein
MDSEELNIAVANEAFAENKVYMLEKQLKQANEHLNESNKIIRQQQLLDEKNLMLEERIKQLEQAGDAMEKYIFDQTNTRFIICAVQWREVKEAKP